MRAQPDPVDGIITSWREVRPELDVSAMEVFGRLHRSFLLYRQEIADRFEALGTSAASFEVLAALRRQPDFRAPAGDLADSTLVTTGGLTFRVRRLEADGLVTRTRDTRDNRVVHVQLTDKGKDLVDRASEEHFGNLAQMLLAMSDAERRNLAKGLKKLEQSIRAVKPGIEPTD